MAITQIIKESVLNSLSAVYQQDFAEKDFQINQTKPEFEGDYTVVLFSLVKSLKKSPETLGQELGAHLVSANKELFASFNLIKGFLNLTIADSYWISLLKKEYNNSQFGFAPASKEKIVIEYSSPNTNKPLHLGHLRNNFLGWSTAEILKANGNNIVKTCIANDRGIHICKSMIAWQKFGNGATPESTGIKGDHLVGDYYVMFGNELKKESRPILQSIEQGNIPSIFSEEERKKISAHDAKMKELDVVQAKQVGSLDAAVIANMGADVAALVEEAKQGKTKWKDVSKKVDKSDEDAADKVKEQQLKQFQKIVKPLITLEEKIAGEYEEIKDLVENKTSIMQAAKQMLVDWEAGKPDVIHLWKMMNSWVYAGFDATYKRIGSDFDKTYYESNTYLLGKQMVEEGLKKGVFFKKDDGSVWIDLTADGLDEKIVQRKDGTAVYITQDIGLAAQKHEEFNYDQSIHVVGDEQNYHFKVLKLICQKLGLPSADGIYHLSYGMVELPTGRMKTREGTVVDADDIVDEMVKVAAQKTEELGKVKDFTEAELKELYDTLGLGALKFFLLRVDPKKRMVFNPEESIDFHGFTGPFVQYTHARIKSILRKQPIDAGYQLNDSALLPREKELLVLHEQFPGTIEQAATEHNPSTIANYVFMLAKAFNTFYTEHSVANAESEEKRQLRLRLSQQTANIIKTGMQLLGIRVPERM